MRTVKGKGLTCKFVYFEGLSKCFLVLRVLEDEQMNWASEKLHLMQ